MKLCTIFVVLFSFSNTFSDAVGARIGAGSKISTDTQEEHGKRLLQRMFDPRRTPIDMEKGDLNMRFNKIPILRGKYLKRRKPLKNFNYPMRGRLALELQRNTTAESVLTYDDYELLHMDEMKYMREAGGAPTYPNKNPNHTFWQGDFRHVIEAQVARRENADPSTLITLPKLWSKFDIHEVAEAVHDEYPGYHQSQLLMQLFSEKVKIDYSVLPFRCVDDFIGLNFRMAHLNTWSTMQVAPTNFRTKWTYGRPRPEEVCWAIAKGRINREYVPADLVKTIRDWRLNHKFNCTAYPHSGSPRHPSYPAMHSAASSASLWMAVVFDLTPDQYCEALRTDWAVSYARTVAGVHYPTDNVAGLKMGQAIVADRLTDYLVKEYGSNREAVNRKIAKFRFDWKDFDHKTCRTAGN